MTYGQSTASVLLAGVVLLPMAQAQTWRLEPAISVIETATNNVNLSPDSIRRSDLVTQITPSLRFSEKGNRTRLDGFVSIPALLHARTGGDNDNVYPTAAVNGDLEIIDNFFHVDGAVSISQEFFNPFGAQPSDLENTTRNRYQTASFRVSPYVQGVTSGKIAYELRNNNVWTNLSGAPIATGNSRYTQWLARASNTQAQLGWRAELDANDIRFNQQNPIQTRLARFSPLYNVDPQLRLNASVGYEDNEYALTSSRDVIYGVGFEWRPTARTNVLANWEHRFFGASYLFSFDHRTPRSIWNVRASRNITTYPQQVATLAPGLDVAGLLNGLFTARIPDPVERQRAVEDFIQSRGLPTVLSSPLPLYSQQILLQEAQTASAGLVGARNSIVFTIFNVRTEPISAAGDPLPPVLSSGNNNTQTGASLVWSHNLTASMLLSASIQGYRTVANDAPGVRTKQGIARVAISMPLSVATSVSAGARYQALQSTVASDYDEAAVFVGLSHSFR